MNTPSKKILIVDDDVDIAEPLALLFEDEGYTVSIITKGNEIYERIDSFHPDIILLDVLMSGSDGRTICKKLKSQMATKSIPVIMMSAHPAAKADSLDSQADAFIAKPFEIKELVQMVSKF